MDTFKRSFPTEHLSDLRRNPSVAALFDRWVLPGEQAGDHGLRLAVRNGYLNFYVKGQSVAELRMSSSEPRLKLHCKYKELAVKGSARAVELGQNYETVRGDALAIVGQGVVDGWIKTAETYAGDEKRFVDDLVAVTPGVIDLEMALPADEGSVGKDRVAPRMDLVVAQGTDIAFWEAKCATNGELRALSPYDEAEDGGYLHGPHVLWQLRRYQRWVDRPNREKEVRSAYIKCAGLLIAFAELFGKEGPALDCWRGLASAGDTAKVILPPGVVVAGYCSPKAGSKHSDKTATYEARLSSFGKHHETLEGHGATVTIVAEKPTSAILPNLQSGAISKLEQRV